MRSTKASPLTSYLGQVRTSPLGLNFLICDIRVKAPFNSNILKISDSLNSVIEAGIRVKLATLGALYRLIHCLSGRLILPDGEMGWK